MVVIGGLFWVAVELWVPREDEPRPTYDAVMVLSSGLHRDGRLDETAANRLRKGLQLAAETKATLITSRVRRKSHPRLISDSGQRILVDSAGLTSSWRILEGVALTTRDEAERLQRERPGIRIALVTSRLHTRRACATFERVGFGVTCVSAGHELPWWMMPYFVAYEPAALLKYRLKGWM